MRRKCAEVLVLLAGLVATLHVGLGLVQHLATMPEPTTPAALLRNTLERNARRAVNVSAIPSVPPSEPPRVLFIFSLDERQLRTLGRASWKTWLRALGSRADSLFFLSDCTSLERVLKHIGRELGARVRCVRVQRSITRLFAAWRQVFSNELDNYDLFINVSPHTYVNVYNLEAQLRMAPLWEPFFGGLPVISSSANDNAMPDGQPYCHGMLHVLNREALALLAEGLQTCQKNPLTTQADLEFSRCVYQHVNITCSSLPVLSVRYGQAGELITARRSLESYEFPEQPKRSFFEALAVYPLAKSNIVYRFHHQVHKQLRPLQPRVAVPAATLDSSQMQLYARAESETLESCVHNPLLQRETMRFSLPECISPYAVHKKNHAIRRGFLMSLTPTASGDVVKLPDFGLELTRVPISINATYHSRHLTPVEGNYLAAMRGVFKMARREGLPRIVVFDENAVLSCNFQDQLDALLDSPRCGGHLLSDYQGGVLLLGAQEWGPLAWQQIEHDMAHSKDRLCYNIHSQTTGAFAAVYHKATYDDILKWLDANLALKHGMKPFEVVFQHLSRLGYVVRAANPALVIQDPRHASALNPGHERYSPYSSRKARVRDHRWNVTEYCHYLELEQFAAGK
eukprot:m.13223 g.13223  ORF g.13223 m.13223 type:complete len:627 (-) comp3284_c0_seq1:287-2167(-)